MDAVPKEIVKFAEGVLRAKAIMDKASAVEAETAKLEAAYAVQRATLDAEITNYLDKVKDAQALHEKAMAELGKRHKEYDAAQASLDHALAEAKDQHNKQLAVLHVQAQSTIQSLNYEKAQAMKATQDAKTLHAAEMTAMGAEKAKLEADLNKLRELRTKMLSQLQTGV